MTDQAGFFDGKALMKNIIVIGNPGTNFQVKFLYEFEDWQVNSSLSFYIKS